MTKEEILEQFLNSFDGRHGNNDGIVSKAEWTDYYGEIAQFTPSEDYFIQMMESVWQITENDDADEVQAVVQDIIDKLKVAIAEKAGGDFKSVFDNYDKNGHGGLTVNEITQMVADCEISSERKYISGVMKAIDADRSGTVEPEEFCAFFE
jgi:Ca2+-binding EF-hand superfamily protein